MNDSGGDRSRDRIPDLLVRPPGGTREFVSSWSHAIVDPVGQLAALADLYAMGLLSATEYEDFKNQVRNR